MKIGIMGALVILILFASVTTAETTDDDILAGNPDSSELLVQGDMIAADVPLAVEPSNLLHYYYVPYSRKDIAKSQSKLQKQLDVLYYIPDHTYLVHASEQDLQRLQKQEYVLDYSLVREDTERFDVGTNEEESLYYVYSFRDTDAPAVEAALEEKGLAVLDTRDYITVLDLTNVEDKEALLREIVQIEGVEAVEQRPHYELFNDRTNVLVGTENIRQRFGLYGAGQIIAITDTGLDTGVLSTLHQDVRGRVISLTRNEYDPGNFCNYNGIDDPNGHGTAVTGTAVGNGLLSGSNPTVHNYTASYAGSAPEAQLVFQAAGCGPTGGLFPDAPMNLYHQAYIRGARVHSHSYGDVGNGGYYAKDRDTDRYSFGNKTFLTVYGAGNSNTPGSVSNNAKNTITVGGVLRDQPNTQVYARGPTQDGRFKPDILSPALGLIGSGITTTYSSIQLPWPQGVCNQLIANPDYCLAGGTSNAAPNGAGEEALVREYYMTPKGVTNPSAALVKATILNGGETLFNGLPDTNYGWGRMNLAKSLSEENNLHFAFWDAVTGLATSGQRIHRIDNVGSNRPFRVTLVWTDKESSCITPSCQSTPRLVNDLDLTLIAPNGQRYNGNDLNAPYDDTWDRLNNVERVEVLSPTPGDYTLQVRGYNVPLLTQDYALVVSYYDTGSVNLPHVVAAAVAICVNATGQQQPC